MTTHATLSAEAAAFRLCQESQAETPTTDVVAPALNIAILAIARRLLRPLERRADIRLDDYKLVARHWDAFAGVARDAPHLIALYGAVCERLGFEQIGEPVQALKQYVVDRCGRTQRLWRLLANSSPRILLPVRDFYTGNVGNAVVDYLRLLDMLALRRMLPMWWLRIVMTRWGNSGQRYRTYAREMSVFAPALRHLAWLAQNTPLPELEAQRRDLPLVVHWISCEGHLPEFDKQQCHAGWPWLLRKAVWWFERQKAEAERSGRTWPVPFRRLLAGDLELVALGNAFELWDEAQAMRHCANDYASDCEDGDTLIVSVRRVADGRRLATAELRRVSGQWSVAQVRGFANAVPDKAVRLALGRLREL